MELLPETELIRILGSTQPITLRNARHMGWCVQVLCTGTAELWERRLCVVGSSLGGHWFRPPATFTDKMVLLILCPKDKPNRHYSIANIPYIQSRSDTWYADWNTGIVNVYTNLVKELFSLRVSSNAPVFLGVSAGVLSTMVLLTSLVTDATVQRMHTPMAVFISGAWHPKAHPELRQAILPLDVEARPQVFVVNHSDDYLCSWPEQANFWKKLEQDYSNLWLVVLDYKGSSAADLFDFNYHDTGSRIAASGMFWNWLMEEKVDFSQLHNVATVACDWDNMTLQTPFDGYVHCLGLRLLCRLWGHMWIPDIKQPDWPWKLLAWMRFWCARNPLRMFRYDCLSDWPTCLKSAKLGEYYLPQLCESIAASLNEGILQSEIQPTLVIMQHLHHTKDMELVDVQFAVKKSDWLSTRWIRGEGEFVAEDTVIFTHPCIIVIRFETGPPFMGFYRSHTKPKSKTKRYLQLLKSLVIACTPEMFRDYGTDDRSCVGIQVLQLTSLMGIGSLGRLIFPPDNPDKRFGAWIAEKDAITEVPDADQFDVSEFNTVLNKLRLYPETIQNLERLMQLVQRNLITAVVGPPGTGKTTTISGLLRLLLQHHDATSPHKQMRIFLCAPTNHAVQELEKIVATFKSEYDFALIRILSWEKLKNKDRTSYRNVDSSVDNCLAQHIAMNSLKQELQNTRSKVTIILSTLGVLQKSPSVTYDPLSCLRNSCNWVLVDEAGQTVDTDAYILHFLLSRNGRYICFGDRKQLSCFSRLQQQTRSAMEVALCGKARMCLTTSFRLTGTLGHFFCQTIYEEEEMQLQYGLENCTLKLVEVPEDNQQCQVWHPRSSALSAKLEYEIVKMLSGTPKKLYYITFYRDQKNFSYQSCNAMRIIPEYRRS